jgi:hypothetical protein
MKFTDYQDLPDFEKLDNYNLLIEIASDFLQKDSHDKAQAIELAKAIQIHRELMGSSKKYEMAVDIDKQLATLGLDVARIAYGTNVELLPYLEGVLYYSVDDKKRQLVEEIQNINQG